MMRLIVSVASSVWSVENTRCPVSAASRPVSIVSKSRISPTRMTSGSCRRALRSAYANERVSTVTSRWLMIDWLSRCRNSIGSSTVITCAQRVRLMWSTMAASVVLLPLPVVPRDEHEAALFAGDLLEDRRQAEIVDRLDLHRDDAEHEADGAALLEDVHAEAPQAGHAVREVHFLRVLELLAVDVRHDRGAHGDDVLVVRAVSLRTPGRARRAAASSGSCRP